MNTNLPETAHYIEQPKPELDKPPAPPTPAEAMKQFEKDPVGFIQGIIEASAGQHLDLMREQLELQSALHFARRYQPDFQRFEPFILQELAQLIQQDEDGILDPWPDLLDRAMERFRERFLALLKKDPEKVKELLAPEASFDTKAHKEKASNKKTKTNAPNYTRKQIESMTLEDFIAQEATINQALKDQRIQ